MGDEAAAAEAEAAAATARNRGRAPSRKRKSAATPPAPAANPYVLQPLRSGPRAPNRNMWSAGAATAAAELAPGSGSAAQRPHSAPAAASALATGQPAAAAPPPAAAAIPAHPAPVGAASVPDPAQPRAVPSAAAPQPAVQPPVVAGPAVGSQSPVADSAEPGVAAAQGAAPTAAAPAASPAAHVAVQQATPSSVAAVDAIAFADDRDQPQGSAPLQTSGDPAPDEGAVAEPAAATPTPEPAAAAAAAEPEALDHQPAAGWAAAEQAGDDGTAPDTEAAAVLEPAAGAAPPAEAAAAAAAASASASTHSGLLGALHMAAEGNQPSAEPEQTLPQLVQPEATVGAAAVQHDMLTAGGCSVADTVAAAAQPAEQLPEPQPPADAGATASVGLPIRSLQEAALCSEPSSDSASLPANPRVEALKGAAAAGVTGEESAATDGTVIGDADLLCSLLGYGSDESD